ncbi:DUF6916 family protein [Rugamonas sp. CCM 8940]|uniref:DUF6916 family protein n=1 Tax=Rugamonas sp. CCM 8940 TaxID=2765359 RepID=UPI0018F3239C|nr:hypothetical protein [Rugamonas sp. CCM 8940]MBJ7309364.1 hypothetical protein [Rugamonas sp. CCM 8940]
MPSSPPALTQTYFAALLNQRFQLAGHDGVELELIAVEARTASLAGGAAFSLLFSGPQPPLPQQIFTLRSAAGSVDIFLVPLASVGAAVHYEAVFN